MTSRRDLLLDAAISVLGTAGARGVTHRAVDAEAGLPAGSTSNYFRTRDALLDAVVERFAARERANWEEIAEQLSPTTPVELAQAMARFAHEATGPQRTLTLARYAILVEAALQPQLRAQLTATGARVTRYFTTWLRVVGSTDPERHTRIIGNHTVGLTLHQLAYPNPHFDPEPELTALIEALLGAGRPATRSARSRPAAAHSQ